MTRWLTVRGAHCPHGASVPVQGISRAALAWAGLFCSASACRPSWRLPHDLSLAASALVSDAEALYRIALAARVYGDWIAPTTLRDARAAPEQGGLW